MKKESFIKGALFTTVCIFITKIIGLLYVIPFYNIIGEQSGALYGYGYTVYSLFLSISIAGLPSAVSKLVSEYDTLGYIDAKKRVYKESYKIVSVICVIIFIFMIIFAPLIAKIIIGENTSGNTLNDIALVIRCVAFSILVVPALSVTRGILRGNKYISATSISEVVEQLVRVFVLLLGSYIVIKILNLSTTIAVCVAMSSAFFGGLASFLYLYFKAKKSKVFDQKSKNKDDITNKTIRKTILKYAIPLIITSCVFSIYSFTDMILIIRTLKDILHIDMNSVETTISVYTTWSDKFHRIVEACSIGIAVSLMPHIASYYVNNKRKEIETTINKSLSLFIFIAAPLTFLISIFSTDIWYIFYELDYEGPYLLCYSIFIILFTSSSMILSTALQSIGKYKKSYISIIIGVLLNIIFDIPLMLLCNYMGLHPVYGAITSSIIANIVSIVLSAYFIKKECFINYNKFYIFIVKITIPLLLLVLSSLLLKNFMINNYDSKFTSVIYVAIYCFVPLLIYVISSYKFKILDYLLDDVTLYTKFKRKFKKKSKTV